MKYGRSKMKCWKVTAHLDGNESDVRSATIKAKTRCEAYEEGKEYFKKCLGAFAVDICSVIEIDENTEMEE